MTWPALPPPFRFAPRTSGAAAHALRAERCAISGLRCAPPETPAVGLV